MNEIDFKNATFDEIDDFVQNILRLQKSHHPLDYDARLTYYATATQVLIARRLADKAVVLALEIEEARVGIGRGIDKLTLAISQASEASGRDAAAATKQARRMVWATWALVIATSVLGIVTGGLVFYTRELVATPPQILFPPR